MTTPAGPAAARCSPEELRGLFLFEHLDADQLEWVSANGDVVDCEGSAPCPLHSGCRLRGALRRAQEAFYASLDPLTVTDMVAAPTGPLLLGITRR